MDIVDLFIFFYFIFAHVAMPRELERNDIALESVPALFKPKNIVIYMYVI